jgi:hypothetical protein
MMTEHWNLYLDTTYTAQPWPWRNKRWDALTAMDVARLPHAVDDFLRYCPSDGGIDMTHVPPNLPREAPHCATRLAVYQDAMNLYVFIAAVAPTKAGIIPELADLNREDFCCAFQLDGHQRGLYFGMNEKGAHIGLPQVWDDGILQAPGDADRYPWRKPDREPDNLYTAKPRPWLREYDARIIRGRGVLTGTFRVEKQLLKTGIRNDTIRFTAGRRCYRTSELVSWGSPVVWAIRTDEMGMLRLDGAPGSPRFPTVRRIDVNYDLADEAGDFIVAWSGPTSGAGLKPFKAGDYAGYMDKYTLALNGEEHTGAIAERTTVRLPLADGWNRLELMTGFGPSRVVSFQHLPGDRIVLAARVPAFRGRPPVPELRRTFRAWHEAMEKKYLGGGTWGSKSSPTHCLCHCGVFNIEPYIIACQYLENRPIYRQRIRECCERVLAAQHPAGWFPCHCAVVGDTTRPQPFEGGAFTHGSVSEALLLAYDVIQDPRYLEAARRAVPAYDLYRWEDNQNYAAFALWHLAELYAREPQPDTFKRAVYYAANFAARGMDLAGAQDGHNYYTGYSYITLKGLAKLLKVLPQNHPYYPRLRHVVVRSTNQALARQQSSGQFAGRNRKYLGYRHSVPGLFYAAAALPDLAPAIAPALRAMYEDKKPAQTAAMATPTSMTAGRRLHGSLPGRAPSETPGFRCQVSGKTTTSLLL